MKVAMMADFLMVKKSLGQGVMVGVICGLIIGLACGNVNIIPAMVMFMVTIGQYISLVALDERNGWEAYRNTLPVSRKQIITGRIVFVVLLAIAYLALGLVIAVAAGLIAPMLTDVFFLAAGDIVLSAEDLTVVAFGSLGAGLALLGVFAPILAKYGMTKATRILPLVFVMIFLLVFVLTGGPDGAVFGGLGAFLDGMPLLGVCAFFLVAGAIILAIGGVLAVRFYQQRQF